MRELFANIPLAEEIKLNDNQCIIKLYLVYNLGFRPSLFKDHTRLISTLWGGYKNVNNAVCTLPLNPKTNLRLQVKVS